MTGIYCYRIYSGDFSILLATLTKRNDFKTLVKSIEEQGCGFGQVVSTLIKHHGFVEIKAEEYAEVV